MRSWLPAAALLLLLAPVLHAAGEVPEQTVTPITPREETVQPVNPKGEQRVEALGSADNVQQVSEGSMSPVRRAADKTAKVAVGVVAFVVSIGATMAALLLL